MAPGVAARLEKAERVSPVTGTGNYSYRSTRMSGRNFLMVGDAYAFIDPVFSSGVHLALNGAFEAQKTVAHILSHPEKARRALRDYEKGVHRGLGIFSWFIYRVRTAAIRDLFMNPRDFFGMQKAIVSVLAGDLYRNTPLWGPLIAFRWVYHVKALAIRLRLSPPVTP
jgi:flavin-dependent dehydrogenase